MKSLSVHQLNFIKEIVEIVTTFFTNLKDTISVMKSVNEYKKE